MYIQIEAHRQLYDTQWIEFRFLLVHIDRDYQLA